MVYRIEITRSHVSYELETCPQLGIDGHTADDCTGDCTWLEGGSRPLSEPEREVREFDSSEFDSPVNWAIETLRPLYSFEPSSYPIGTVEREHAWLSACDRQSDGSHIEVTARLAGRWTPAQRARAFRRITA